jgi:hypothetical protein
LSDLILHISTTHGEPCWHDEADVFLRFHIRFQFPEFCSEDLKISSSADKFVHISKIIIIVDIDIKDLLLNQ